MFSGARFFDGLADGIASREIFFDEQFQSVMRAGNNRVGMICSVRHSAFLAIAVLIGASMSHAASVEGYWYGTGYQSTVRRTMQWLAIWRSDGTFSVEFREYENCRPKFFQTETGRWAASEDVITEKTLAIDGVPVPDTSYFSDTYKIIELNDRKMRIVHEKSRQEWTLERVTPNFAFPDCEYVS